MIKLSPDNQEIVDNANAAEARGDITHEQRNDAVRLAIANETEARILSAESE